jgi:hypothetical protein
MPPLRKDILMTSVVNFLLDGPIMTAPERRKTLIARMAQVLIRHGALASDSDAIRALHADGYSIVDVAILAGEARTLAYQEIVAREMSES